MGFGKGYNALVKVVRRCPRLHDIVKDDAYIYGILVVMNDSLDVGHLKNNNNPVIKNVLFTLL